MRASVVRNSIFLAIAVAFFAFVIGGYAWVYKTGGSFARIKFGLPAIAPVSGRPAGFPKWSGAAGDYEVGKTQAKIKTFLRNQFVGFDHILLGYSSGVTEANKRFYAIFLPKQSISPLGVDSADMFLLKGQNAIVGVTLSKSDLPQAADEGAAEIKKLIAENPGVHFAAYGVSGWTMTPEAARDGYVDPLSTAWDEFSKDLTGTIPIDKLHVTDWTTTFFRTDHHWAPPGAYQGYLDVMNLLSVNNKAIGIKRVAFGQRVIPHIKFRGASARRAAYAGIWERFRVQTIHDPAVHAYVDGKKRDGLIVNKKFLSDPPNTLFYSDYEVYNGTDYPLLELRQNAAGAGNLLVLGDSYCNSMDDLVASHYHRMYRVDLRYYQGAMGKPFDINAFIKQYAINDVLFMGRPYRVMTMPVALRDKKPIL